MKKNENAIEKFVIKDTKRGPEVKLVKAMKVDDTHFVVWEPHRRSANVVDVTEVYDAKGEAHKALAHGFGKEYWCTLQPNRRYLRYGSVQRPPEVFKARVIRTRDGSFSFLRRGSDVPEYCPSYSSANLTLHDTEEAAWKAVQEFLERMYEPDWKEEAENEKRSHEAMLKQLREAKRNWRNFYLRMKRRNLKVPEHLKSGEKLKKPVRKRK